MNSEPTTQSKPKYGGRTSCGHPHCSPDPDLAQQLDAFPELLAALEFCRSVIDANGPVEMSERMAIEKADAAIKKARGKA